MKYYIQRQLSEYGPYTVADLQRYVAQGNILLTDLARSEGMTEWVPVSQVLGNTPMPAAAMTQPQSGTVYGGVGTQGTTYGGTGSVYGGQAATHRPDTPVPTDFHWALVLLLGIFTCGIFSDVWLIIEAAFVKKIKPESKGLLFMILAIGGAFFGGFLGRAMSGMYRGGPNPMGALIVLASVVLYFVAVFQMRSDLEDYYNRVEPINLRLSGVMTFFFAVWYFQYHLSRIAQWKKTGVLPPQG